MSSDDPTQPPPDPFDSEDQVQPESSEGDEDAASRTFIDDLETPEAADDGDGDGDDDGGGESGEKPFVINVDSGRAPAQSDESAEVDALASQAIDFGHNISDVVLIETESTRLPSTEELAAMPRSDRYEEAPSDEEDELPASGADAEPPDPDDAASPEEPSPEPPAPPQIIFDPEEEAHHPSADNLSALRGSSTNIKALTPRGSVIPDSIDRSGAPMIHLENVFKAFGKREILRGVELAIFPGETVCLIGGSGTGKSVSLKHIMRLLDPDRGRIWLDGEDITEAHGDRLQDARRKLGVNFQFGALLNWLTVFENVALPLRENTDMPDAEIERRVMSKLELLKIPHARDLFPTQISGGMVKRAGLARAVVMEESLKVILYDEPTSGLDPISTALVDEMVNEMKARLGLTQVIVTHDMASAYRTADRIAVLYEGQVVQYGTPFEIQNSTVPYVQQFVRGLSSADKAEEVIKRKSGRIGKKVTE